MVGTKISTWNGVEMITEKPREIILNNISFSEQELIEIKQYFSTKDSFLFKQSERDILKKLQKALRAGAVLCLTPPSDGMITLNLSQKGRLLLGKI